MHIIGIGKETKGLLVLMNPLGSPLMRVEYNAMHTVSMARLAHCSGRPIFSIIFWRNSHSTLSYALLMSSLTAMWPFFHFLLFLIQWIILKAIVVLSVIILSGMKALCESDITLGKVGFILFARTLEIIQDTTFSKLIGRNSIIYSGSFFFFFWDKNNMCIVHFS